ncbi:hypothetical protein Kisp01_23290 [Kineosporia sp. NBRC 101677]|nr:hypothetical protein Kisp01_23290 [Kineosporia sp. NBRC 101677]
MPASWNEESLRVGVKPGIAAGDQVPTMARCMAEGVEGVGEGGGGAAAGASAHAPRTRTAASEGQSLLNGMGKG